MIIRSEVLCGSLAVVFVSTLYLLFGAGVSFSEPEPGPRDTILFDRYKDSRKEAGEISPVLFSHSDHKKTLKCPDCHPGVFAPKMGANMVTEQGNMDGEFCGFCHGDRLWECDLCHK